MKAQLYFILFFTCLVFTASAQQQDTTSLTCQLVQKSFINKKGKATNTMDWYLRCSIQDYFIKLCESSIKEEELKPYLDKGIEVKVIQTEGEWDSCDEENRVQSRTGTYIAILEIIE